MMRVRFKLGFCAFFLLAACASPLYGQERAALVVRVQHDGTPVAGARIRVAGVVLISDSRGEARAFVTPGPQQISADRIGFADTTLTVTVAPRGTTIIIQLQEKAIESQAIVATAARGSTVVADQPVRVVAVPQEEIEENLTIAPGSATMLLQELPGVRLDASVPGLGGSAIRLRGLPSRHTRVLIDGLPLLGPEPDAFGLLQTPPIDLAHVEVVPGIASALYGGSALGGVINLVSKQPEADPSLLLSAGSLHTGDVVAFSPGTLSKRWGYTVTGGAHAQERGDPDHDGWSEIAGYRRAEVRPRAFYHGAGGARALVTVGATAENRTGGSNAFPEALDTRRLDGGATATRSLTPRLLLGARASFALQTHDRTFGTRRVSERQATASSEASLGGTFGAHTWVIGAAIETERLRAAINPGAEFNYVTSSAFVLDEVAIANALKVSGSARLDRNSAFGSFASPRISILLRPADELTVRLSGGSGWAAPHPLTEEVQAVGLGQLRPLRGLVAERAVGGALDVGWTTRGVELSAGFFATQLRHPLSERTNSTVTPPKLELFNGSGPRDIRGIEALAHVHYRALQLLTSYTYLDAWQDDPGGGRQWAERTPRHSGEIGLILEREAVGRAGLEVAYSGRMRIENNPYRGYSTPFAEVNFLAAKSFGETQVFFNALNLIDVRQSRYDPLMRPSPSPLGQPATDVWAPLAGRTFNLGILLTL